MASFLDVVPVKGRVTIGDQDVDVPGLSFGCLAQLCDRFPDFAALLNGGAEAEQLMGLARSTVVAVIAAGCGFPGDAKAEAHAGTFPADQQLVIMTEIVRVTTREGFGPFAKRVVAALDGKGGQPVQAAPTSAPPSPDSRSS